MGRKLLEAGLATALVVPPNLWQHECYAAVENRARALRRGIWQQRQYQPVDASELTPRARGFRIVRGKVRRVGESRDSLWLDLSRDVALRILKDDLHHFQHHQPTELRGQTVEARGWLQRRRGQLRMRIRHPAALKVLD